MSKTNSPDFAALLAPFITAVPVEALPNFLALLERGAAQRYREWAQLLPDFSEGLHACAASEDRIADIIEELFPIDDTLTSAIASPLPATRTAYYQVFAGLPLADQLQIQADAELQGAAAWQGMLVADMPDAIRDGLQQCSALEEASSSYLRTIVEQVRASEK